MLLYVLQKYCRTNLRLLYRFVKSALDLSHTHGIKNAGIIASFPPPAPTPPHRRRELGVGLRESLDGVRVLYL